MHCIIFVGVISSIIAFVVLAHTFVDSKLITMCVAETAMAEVVLTYIALSKQRWDLPKAPPNFSSSARTPLYHLPQCIHPSQLNIELKTMKASAPSIYNKPTPILAHVAPVVHQPNPLPLDSYMHLCLTLSVTITMIIHLVPKRIKPLLYPTTTHSTSLTIDFKSWDILFFSTFQSQLFIQSC